MQTRAQGISRAILDTFTIVKFRSPPGNADPDTGMVHKDDIEARRSSSIDKPPLEVIELPSLSLRQPNEQEDVVIEHDSVPSSATQTDSATAASPTSPVETHAISSAAGPSTNFLPVPRPLARPVLELETPVLPDAIGRETCPICIIDFEDEDELRVLPCVGQHRFHRACVDPWLLELSASCPLCRHGQCSSSLESPNNNKLTSIPADFHALETLIAGEERSPVSPRASQGRFSRYVRFARRHGRGDHGQGFSSDERRRRSAYENDPTDPPMPLAPMTAL
jgi:hypothetical protein